jgi:ATP-dependent DNA helicase RecQ
MAVLMGTVDRRDEAMDVPNCPDCGRPMQLRTARTGRNPGRKFWGCTGFPTNCRSTLDVTPSSTVAERTSKSDLPHSLPNYARSRMPRPIIVAASSSQQRASIYEGIAIPRLALDAITFSVSEETRRALSQWLAEWPRNFSPATLGEVPPWIAVTGKLLRRGSVIPLDPTVEKRLRPFIGDPSDPLEEDWMRAIDEILTLPIEPLFQHDTFDSEAEREFFEAVLPTLAPVIHRRYWQRQVSIGSLTGDKRHSEANQRVDFVLAYPDHPTVVVEIDGKQHALQQDEDAQRDALLKEFGIEVQRIPTTELTSRDGPALRRLSETLSVLPQPASTSLSVAGCWLFAGRRVQQIQLLLLEALEMGIIPCAETPEISIHIGLDELPGQALEADIAAIAIEDFNNLIRDVGFSLGLSDIPILRLSGVAESSFSLSFSSKAANGSISSLPVRDAYVPAPPELYVPRTRPFVAQNVDRSSCERLLLRVYGYNSFREGQFEAVERALRGHDSIVLLPTGSGKSIAFQLAAFLRPGVAIVVDPIISLIEDQLENLRTHGIDRAERITGIQTVEERGEVHALLGRTQFWLCYIAPERFQSMTFRNSLLALTTNTPVSLVAVDEAHCVSEWGHYFRPAYPNLARIAREYCSAGNASPPIMALTGTASRSVLKDVQRELEILDFDSVIVPKSFDRKELSFEAIPCRSAEKPVRLNAILDQLPMVFGEHRTDFFSPKGTATRSGLIFCPHVNWDHGIVGIGKKTAEHLGISVPGYGSKTPKGESEETWTAKLRRTADGFKRNRFAVMTATKAFGMGIDKPNIRYTIHYNIPSSIEAFYQEAGRAGRDGNSARCFVLFSDDFPSRTAKLLDPATTTMDLQKEVKEAGFDRSDDITRALFFHNNTFKGMEKDGNTLTEVLKAIGPLDKPGKTKLRFGGADDRKLKEQALHRLVMTGALADYTINYSSKQFQIVVSGAEKEDILEHLYRYVASYQRQRGVKAVEEARQYLARPHNDFILVVARQLTQFVYDVVERGRRHSLSEILRVCKNATDGESIRTEILKYLERSKYADQIESILDSDHAGIDLIAPVIEDICSFIDAAELRGECARELESYPDQPSLRLLRAVAEAMTQLPDNDTIRQNVKAAVQDGIERYGLPLDKLLDAVVVAADVLSDSRPQGAQLLLQSATFGAPERRIATRFMIKRARKRLLGPLLALLLSDLARSVQQLNGR